MHELNETKHVFLSYNWSIKNQVKQLDEHLTNLGFKVMRDENFLQANESSLKGQLANAIKNARIFICCITQAYCQSHACNLEIELADSLDKPMIVLMIENLNPVHINLLKVNGKNYSSGVGFIINHSLRINCFDSDGNVNINWQKYKLDEIKNSIQKHLTEFNKNHSQLENENILNGRYKKIEKIGEGSQAIIYKVEDILEYNKIKCLKQFKSIGSTGSDSSSEEIKWIEKEIEILKNINNEYILKYLDSFEISLMGFRIYFIITNHYDNGTLNHAILTKKYEQSLFEFDEIKLWSKQLLEGIDFLHQKKIIHRDIKPYNIFVNGANLVIGDFGHAKLCENNSRYSLLSRPFGTECYNAPEANKPNYSNKVDIWSFGCILYEIIKLERLFNDTDSLELALSIMNFDIDQHILIKNKTTHSLFIQQLKKSLSKESTERYSAKQLIDLIDIPDNLEHDPDEHAPAIKSDKVKDFLKIKNKINTQKDKFISIQMHTNWISCLIALDSEYLASASWDKTIKIFNFKTNSILNILTGHESSVHCICSLVSDLLASGSNDHSIIIWNYKLGLLLNKIEEAHKDCCVWSLAYLKDYNLLASGSDNQSIKIWDYLKNKKEQQEIISLDIEKCYFKNKQQQNSVSSLCYLGDDLIAFGSYDQTIKIWNIKSKKKVHILEGHKSSIECIILLDDNLLASSSWDKTIKIWNYKKGKKLKTLKGHNGGIFSLTKIPNLNLLVSGSWDNTIKIWNYNSKKNENELVKTLQEGHSDRVTSVCYLQSEKDLLLASASRDMYINIWFINENLFH